MHVLRHFTSHKVVGAISNQCRRLVATSVVPPYGDKPKSERCINKVTLLGRVGKAAEIRGTEENTCMIFPLATNMTFKRAATGEVMKRTDWHRICVFRPGLKDFTATLNKGDRIFVGGALSYNRVTDSDDNSHFVTSILADEIIMLSRKNTEGYGAKEEDDL